MKPLGKIDIGPKLYLRTLQEDDAEDLFTLTEANRLRLREWLPCWVDAKAQGKALMTLAVKALIGYGFSELHLQRVVIRCATGNTLSQGIPKRLGFSFKKLIPQNENLYGRFVDHLEYELMKDSES